jgi:hypothetical protein
MLKVGNVFGDCFSFFFFFFIFLFVLKTPCNVDYGYMFICQKISTNEEKVVRIFPLNSRGSSNDLNSRDFVIGTTINSPFLVHYTNTFEESNFKFLEMDISDTRSLQSMFDEGQSFDDEVWKISFFLLLNDRKL